LNLPNQQFDIILMDPPWSYYGQQDKWGAAAKFYSTMTDDDLINMNIGQVIHNKSIIFMWATSPRLDFAIRLLEAWNIYYRGVAFVWVKTKKSCPQTPVGAMGVRPSFVKPTSEYVIVGSPQRKGRPQKLYDESISQIIFAPKGKHSQKPEEIQDRIDKMYPNATKLEMFARRQRPGWVVWGNEV